MLRQTVPSTGREGPIADGDQPCMTDSAVREIVDLLDVWSCIDTSLEYVISVCLSVCLSH